MFAAVRVYEGVDPSGAQEIARLGQDGLIPLLPQAPGFIDYHLVQASDGTWVSISLFQDRAGAEGGLDPERRELGPRKTALLASMLLSGSHSDVIL